MTNYAAEPVNVEADEQEITPRMTVEYIEERKLTVLVVEDNDSERWRLCAMLKKLGYDILEAVNGDEALARQIESPADIVVSDWQMPGMDGLKLCQLLKTEAQYKSPYFIMLTGMNNPVDLVAGMESGADDFVQKPCAAEELRVRVQAGARIQRLRYKQERTNRVMRVMLRRERRTMQRIHEDLGMAAELQRGLLPEKNASFEDISLSTLFRPADAVGGDFFNYFRLGEHHLAFYLLDVSGHGVAAAMMSFSIAYLLSGEVGRGGILMRTGAEAGQPELPSRVLSKLNQRFQEMDDRGRHFTMVYGVLDLRDGSGQLCQAGHPHPMILGADGSVSMLGNGGFPAGMLPDVAYEDTGFTLASGDRLLVCSDGVFDCMLANESHSAPGLLADRLMSDSGHSAESLVNAMEVILDKQCSAGQAEDDISVLAISRL